MTFGTIELAGC